MPLKVSIETSDNQQVTLNDSGHETKSLPQKRENFEMFFSNIYKDNFQLMYNYGMNICGDASLVKDSIQDLFAELWNKKKLVSNVDVITPYLFKCLRRKINLAIKKNKNIYSEHFSIETSHEMRIIRQEDDSEKKKLVSSAIEKLTPRQREAIFLRFYSKFSYEDTGHILKVSTKAVYKLIHRALVVLKEEIGKS
jgi:RNA polymerase sigma factor (sigma-70 family)